MTTHYTIPQVAELVGKSPQTVRLWIYTGKLQAEKVININGRAMWLVSADSVAQYEKPA